jgi:arylsulfatase A-like enzyme
LAVALPFAAAAAVELGAALVSAGIERPHVARAAGIAAILEASIGIALGGIAAALARKTIPGSRRGVSRLLGGAPFAVLAAGAASVLFARPPFPGVERKSSRAPDVLLVVLDTTRADAVPSPAGSPSATPALARLAAEGTLYRRAFSTSCWTLPAHASLFTGVLPQEHGTGWESRFLPLELETLPEVFRGAGYRTAAFSANIWISPEFQFDQGVDRFETIPTATRPYRPWILRLVPALERRLDAALPFGDKGGLSLSSDALRFLGARDDRPAFVFLNLLEAHIPYEPPGRFLGDVAAAGFTPAALARIDQEPLRGLIPETQPNAREIQGLRLLYAAEVAYDDWLLGRILEPLRRAGRLDETIVVVVGDHGENLGQHAPLDHQLGLWDTLVHVPLMVRYPKAIAAGRLEDGLVSIVDVHRAILHLAGLAKDGAPGPLLGTPKRDAVFFSYDRPTEPLLSIRRRLRIDPAPWDRRLTAVRTDGAKLILGSDGTTQAYDLEADPGETRDRAAGGVPADLSALADRLREIVAKLKPAAPSAPREMSDEARRQLRSLGYVN